MLCRFHVFVVSMLSQHVLWHQLGRIVTHLREVASSMAPMKPKAIQPWVSKRLSSASRPDGLSGPDCWRHRGRTGNRNNALRLLLGATSDGPASGRRAGGGARSHALGSPACCRSLVGAQVALSSPRKPGRGQGGVPAQASAGRAGRCARFVRLTSTPVPTEPMLRQTMCQRCAASARSLCRC